MSTTSSASIADDVRQALGADLDLAGVAHIDIRFQHDQPLHCVIGLSDNTRHELMSLLDEPVPGDDALAHVVVYGPNGEVQRRETPLDTGRLARLRELAQRPIVDAEDDPPASYRIDPTFPEFLADDAA